MATQITIGVDRGDAKQGLTEVAQGIKGIEQAADKAGAASDAAFDNANQVQDLKEAVQSLTDQLHQAETEVEDLQSDLDELAGSANHAGEAVKGVGATDTTVKLAATAAVLNQGLEVLRKVGAAATMARDYIKALGDGGNEDFAHLSDAITKVEDSFIRFTDRLANSQTGKGVTGFFASWGDSIAGGIDGLHELGDTATTLKSGAMAELWDTVGLESWAEAERENISLIQKQAFESEQAYQAELKRQRVNKQTADADKLIADFEAARAAAAEKERIQRITDGNEIVKQIADEQAKLKELAKDDQLTSDQLQASRKKLNDLEQRRIDLEKEGSAARKKAADDEKKAREETLQGWEDGFQNIITGFMSTLDRVAQAIQQQRDKQKVEEEKDKAEAEDADQAAQQPFVDAFNGMQSGEGNPVQQILDKSRESRAIAKELAEQAGQAAFANMAEAGGSERDANTVATAARRKAFRQARNQLERGGPEVFSQDQLAGAVQQNTQGQIDALQKTGDVGDAAVNALGQVVQAQLQAEQRSQQQQQQIDSIMQVFNQNNNGRRRPGGR